MIILRLNQLASQQANDGGLKLTRAYKPHSAALTAIPELRQIWRANTHERLQQALDKAQTAILKALESDNPNQRLERRTPHAQHQTSQRTRFCTFAHITAKRTF